MVQFRYEHLFQLKNHGVPRSRFAAEAAKLPRFLELIRTRGQGFYDLPDDTRSVAEILEYARKVRGKFDHIVVLGIGGSALGVTCLLQTLKHPFWNVLPKRARKEPQLFVLDNIDPSVIAQLEETISYKKTLFIVATKSGTTPETMSQYYYFRAKMEREAGRIIAKKHFVFVTDAVRGVLRGIAAKDGIPCFTIPDNVGGRFSVLSPVGLLPAALLGIDIKKLLGGARVMRDAFFEKRFVRNTPFQLATIQYVLEQERGVAMTVIMPYSSALYSLADWYRQLLAESIGKSETVGLTPIKALGVTDQHSQIQLYTEGPRDKFIVFLEVAELYKKQLVIPSASVSDPSMAYLKGVTFQELMSVEKRATEQALFEYGRPTATLSVARIDPETLGALFMLFEGSIAFLGEFYDINAFDQPGVELGKIYTKKILS